MAQEVEEQQSRDEKHCTQCKSPMPTDARLCTKCNSYQDIRGWLPTSATVLAMLVALVTVTTSALQAAGRMWTGSRSFVTLSNPVIQGTSIYVTASNTGQSPGVITFASLSSDALPGPVHMVPKTPADTFIASGTRQSIFDVQLKLGIKEGTIGLLEAISRGLKGQSSGGGQLIIRFRESDGRPGAYTAVLDPMDIAQLLEAHVTRCSAEGIVPSYDNGCLSLDEFHNNIQNQLRGVSEVKR